MKNISLHENEGFIDFQEFIMAGLYHKEHMLDEETIMLLYTMLNNNNEVTKVHLKMTLTELRY